MEPRPWRVSVLSTVADLGTMRSVVVDHLRERGFEPLAFQEPDFPVEPGVDTGDACLYALGLADIVLLLIDSRYGSRFKGDPTRSVTQAEYRQAVARGCVIVPCITRQAWDDYRRVSEKVREHVAARMTVAEARARVDLFAIKEWGVVDFIDEVINAGLDDWISFYDQGDAPGLLAAVDGRLRGLTRWQLVRIVSRQTDSVRARKTAMSLDLSLGDVLDLGLYVEPPFALRSGVSSRKSASALDMVDDGIEHGSPIAIIGKPGTGKSTLLARAFMRRAELAALPAAGYEPAFFMSLRGRGAGFHFNFAEYIDECFSTYLGMQPYPALDLSLVRPIIYLDGLDELAEDAAVPEGLPEGADLFNLVFAIASRARSAEALVRQIGISDRLQGVLEVLEWSSMQSLEYARRYSGARTLSDSKATLATALVKNAELEELTRNPLTLTLLMWLVEEGHLASDLTVLDVVSLFARTMDHWVAREVDREFANLSGITHAIGEEATRACWQNAAWMVYRERLSGRRKKLRELLEDLKTTAAIELPESLTCALLDIDLLTGEILGMLHERFLEYLVAERLVVSLISGTAPFPEFLSAIVRSDVNMFMRGLVTRAEVRDREAVLGNLTRAYEESVGDSAANVAIRTHAAYFLSRLGGAADLDRLEAAAGRESAIPVRLSIMFGLVKDERYDQERLLCGLIQTNEEWASANRGYHLAYYGDLAGAEVRLPVHDPLGTDWQNVLRALTRHILSPDPRHVAMRRIEIVTIRQLLESRGRRGPLSGDAIIELDDAIGRTPGDIPFHDELMTEWDRLLVTWADLPA